MAVLVSWPKSSLHHYSWPFTNFKRQLHWFAPSLHFTSFCTGNSHFYKLLLYQQIIVFKRKTLHLKMDCLDITVLAFIFKLYAVPHLWNILHNIFPTWCWDSQALPTIKHFIIWGFRIKDSSKSTSSWLQTCFVISMGCVSTLWLCMNWIVWGKILSVYWKFVYI